MIQIALFGTSADPPTAAHQHILKWLAERYDKVLVWASDNPFKTHQTPLEHRATMLQLLIDDISPRQHTVELYPELSSPRALLTVEKVQSLWPTAELTLVIGADLVEQLPRWYRVDELLKRVQLLIVPRPGFRLEPSSLHHLRSLGATLSIANLEGLELSSTDYREQKDPNVIIPPIEAYIHRENLYACDADPKSLVTQSPNQP